MGSLRARYGVELRGVSGQETIWVTTRAEANRIRRVIAMWCKDINNCTDAITLEALATLAQERKGRPAIEIITEFNKRKLGV